LRTASAPAPPRPLSGLVELPEPRGPPRPARGALGHAWPAGAHAQDPQCTVGVHRWARVSMRSEANARPALRAAWDRLMLALGRRLQFWA